MELRHLRCFVAVAEERHFGRAARRLHIAQPPVTRHVQFLEQELGFLLFDRSHRRVELTAAGAVLLGHARRVFEAIDLGVRAARRASEGQTGRITVGYPSSVAFSGLPELLRAFRARSPEVEIDLRELSPQEQVGALKEGRIDVGFIRGPIRDEELALRRVRSEPLVVALPAGHALTARRRIALEALAREPFIAFPRHRSPAFFDYLISLCHAAGFSPNVVQEAPQLDLVSLVAAGFGVALVPGSVKHSGRPGIAFRPIVGAPRAELLVASRQGDGSPVLRDFLAIVREVGVQSGRGKR